VCHSNVACAEVNCSCVCVNDLLSSIRNPMKELLKVDTGCLNTCRSKGCKGDGGACYDGKCLCIQYILKLKHKFTFKVKFHTLSFNPQRRKFWRSF